MLITIFNEFNTNTMHTSNSKYSNLLEANSDLNANGYTKSFVIKPDGLHCLETKETFQPTSIKITEYHRFEGATDYEDMAILYVIETSNGLKGTITDAFGTYANTELGDFLRQVTIIDN